MFKKFCPQFCSHFSHFQSNVFEKFFPQFYSHFSHFLSYVFENFFLNFAHIFPIFKAMCLRSFVLNFAHIFPIFKATWCTARSTASRATTALLRAAEGSAPSSPTADSSWSFRSLFCIHLQWSSCFIAFFRRGGDSYKFSGLLMKLEVIILNPICNKTLLELFILRGLNLVQFQDSSWSFRFLFWTQFAIKLF